MKSRTSGYNSDSEQNLHQDLSILRKPIHTALAGFLEAKKAYDNGTEEIRRLLSRECDIIYECKICRNMFRSLTNFISHKRVYCRNAFNLSNSLHSHNNGFIDQDISTIIQAEQEFVNKSTIKDNKNNENSSKDLSSIIERLLKREQTNRILKLTDFYDQVNNKLTQEEVLRKKHVLQLDNVPNSKVAVYQTVKKDAGDNIKKEVTEVNDLLINDDTVLGPDGRIVDRKPRIIQTLNKSDEFIPMAVSDVNKIEVNVAEENITCEICDIKFSTEKTLKLHIQAKHIKSTFVYQCPTCSQTFLQPGAVIRHLSNDHKKSMRRIRLMRESIFKRRVRIDEVQAKGPSRELTRLQANQEKPESTSDIKAWAENTNLNGNTPTCQYCGKTFERKAVLTTHLSNCLMKNNKASISKKINEVPTNKDSDIKGDVENDFNEEIELIENLANSSLVPINISDIYHNDIEDNKHKRKRTPKVLIKNDEINDVDGFNQAFWNIDDTEVVTLKPISIDSLIEPSEPKPVASPEKIEQPPTNKLSKDVSFFCKICEKKFDALSNLRRHISMFHYRRRKYGCKMCDYRAFRKYDVINHLSSTHSIMGERDVVLEYLAVHEDEKSEDHADADVIISENGSFEPRETVIVKKRRRTKVLKPPKLQVSPEKEQTELNVKTPLSKFTRSASNLSISSADEQQATTGISRRPIRNRVKPVKKDFVYDLSNLLKKDMVLSEKESTTTLVPAKTQKRRNTVISVPDDSLNRDEVITNGNITEVKIVASLIKGASTTMAQKAVLAMSACFNKPPEIPLERPSIPSRNIGSVRSDSSSCGDWASQKEEHSENDQKYPRTTQSRGMSDDVLYNAFPKRRKLENGSGGGQLSTTNLTVELNSNINLNTDKLKLSINGNQKSNQIDNVNNDKVKVKCPTEKEFQEYLIANKLTEPVKKLPVPSFTDSSMTEFCVQNPKRITLMQRLAENKHKKLQNSLLKSALEN